MFLFIEKHEDYHQTMSLKNVTKHWFANGKV